MDACATAVLLCCSAPACVAAFRRREFNILITDKVQDLKLLLQASLWSGDFVHFGLLCLSYAWKIRLRWSCACNLMLGVFQSFCVIASYMLGGGPEKSGVTELHVKVLNLLTSTFPFVVWFCFALISTCLLFVLSLYGINMGGGPLLAKQPWGTTKSRQERGRFWSSALPVGADLCGWEDCCLIWAGAGGCWCCFVVIPLLSQACHLFIQHGIWDRGGNILRNLQRRYMEMQLDTEKQLGLLVPSPGALCCAGCDSPCCYPVRALKAYHWKELKPCLGRWSCLEQERCSECVRRLGKEVSWVWVCPSSFVHDLLKNKLVQEFVSVLPTLVDRMLKPKKIILVNSFLEAEHCMLQKSKV